MGCTNSKIDDLPAVMMCRDRCGYLEQAINQRFALAEAHVAYTHSLKTIGSCLHRFIEHGVQEGGGIELNLPQQRKGDPLILSGDDEGPSSPEKQAQNHHLPHHSRSNSSGSHLHIQSDSEDDEEDYVHHLHSEHSGHLSPPLYDHNRGNYDEYSGRTYYMNDNLYQGSGGGGFLHMNYMKKSENSVSKVVYEENPVRNETIRFLETSIDGGGGGGLRINYMKNKAGPSSVVYEQSPMIPESVQYGQASSSGYFYPNNPYQASSSSSPYPYYGHQNYGGGGGGGDGGGGGGSGGMGYYGSPSQSGASTSKPPPPPPPPSGASTWDFLNPFDGYDSYYPPYTPSRHSKEIREEEGIPDLEDEDGPHEVVKEVHGDHMYVAADDDDGRVRAGNYSKSVMMENGNSKAGEEAETSLYQTRPSASVENDRMEYEVHVVDKKVVDDERSGERKNAGFKGGSMGVSEVAVMIKIQFERASDCGNEIAQMLEVGNLRYQRKYVSKMLHGLTPSASVIASQPSSANEASSSPGNAGPTLKIDEDLTLRSKNLSSTLQKLYLWEKKLYNEVKAEEKMRVVHDKKVRKLKRLDERGAEAHKVDATRTMIRSLSTKIRMAIQVVDNISVTINKIRDEEFWPQLNKLIQGLTRMWKNMLDCHRRQCQAIREAGGFSALGSTKKVGDAHLDITLELEHELINWTSNFSSWISAQKGYVRALNSWLVKCLWYEPEETPDGIVPFSPGRMGAPPIFVICNQWVQAMDGISEKEVLDAMRVFAANIFHVWEQDKVEMRQRMMANKDLEIKVRNLDREDQKIQKEIKALDKKIVLVGGAGNSLSISGDVVYQSDTRNASLRGCLQQIFDAMERFTAESLKAYEELIQRTEEQRGDQA